MCPNLDSNIDLPHWKCVCCFSKQCPPLSMTDEESSPFPFMPYIKYNVYNNRNRCIIHGLCPLTELK